MLNKEKFAEEIVEIAIDGKSLGVLDGKPIACEEIDCKKCDFGEYCEIELMEWANSEYVEPLKLTRRARAFCEAIENGWIVRSENGTLAWYDKVPNLSDDRLSIPTSYLCKKMPFYKDLNFIKNEPWAIEELLKLEVIE